jgi:hypothetical protein
MSIFIIAAIVVGLALALYFIRLIHDGQKEKRRVEEWQRSRARQERMLKEDHEAWKRGEPPIRIDTPIEVDWGKRKDDDTTKILPILPPGAAA